MDFFLLQYIFLLKYIKRKELLQLKKEIAMFKNSFQKIRIDALKNKTKHNVIDNSSVKVESGIKLSKLSQVLETISLSLHVRGRVPDLSVCDAIAVGTAGSTKGAYGIRVGLCSFFSLFYIAG